MNLTKDDLDVLEEILNEELNNYLDSGYSLNSDYAIELRNLIKKLGLKETYNFERCNK